LIFNNFPSSPSTGSFNNAAVGTAIGMANGVQALDRNRQVIAMCGDGGFTMLMQELFTAAQHDLPIKCIVFNNGGWGLVHLEMEEAGFPAFEGVKFKNPDFAMFAQACGGTGFRITKPSELRDGIQRALATPGPVVVDVLVNAEEIPSLPHIDPAMVLKFALGKGRELISR
jgi:pyruvate dehydrogenase (quinone)